MWYTDIIFQRVYFIKIIREWLQGRISAYANNAMA